MRIHRRGFMATMGSAFAVPGIAVAAAKPSGSGSFGEWIDDEHGLPAFRYTCDQIADKRAVTPVSPGLLGTTDHIHQLGNDRVVALAYNYGHVQLRQDEGAPKILNVYSAERSQFGGGIGWLTDGSEVLTTWYTGHPESFERIFGIGYLRKRVRSSHYSVDQIISAPFGDDPVLLSQVTIVNHGSTPADLRWIEYWGCQVYQFSFRSFIEGNPNKARLAFGDCFAHQFSKLPDGSGLLEKKQFLGRTPEEEAAWKTAVDNLAAHPNPFLAPVKEGVPGSSFDDLNPPATFLSSLDAAADGVSTNAKAFFGAGGPANPAGQTNPLDGDLTASGPESGLLLERKITLRPGEQRTLYFLYGYTPAGTSTDSLIARYKTQAPNVWSQSCASWKKSGVRFDVPAEPWIARETIWNYYYVRSGLTYDDFFGEHIPSQGTVYQYTMGFQGAARDPLQHALPFLFSDPQLTKETLRYTLKEVRADGSIPYGIVGHGTVMPTTSDNSSDMPLWLLWAVSEYVLATRDKAFLDEKIPALLTTPGGQTATVRELLARCYRHLVDDVHTGDHSLMRMLQDDWNDALVTVWALRASAECVARGESVLNSAMAAWVFDYYARLLKSANDAARAGEVTAKAEQHRKAVREQWNGKWFKRAWLGPTLGWLGESTLWLEPQPWAIVAGITTPEQTQTLVRNMDESLRKPSPIGALQMDDGPDGQHVFFEHGTSVNGGVWPSLNLTLVWALAQVSGEMAWDEWKKNSLARHAEVYPDIWYETWSGPDSLNSVRSKTPGEAVNSPFFKALDFPVMCLHAHACSLYSITKLLGLEFTEAGVRLRPVIPLSSWRFESTLLGLRKTAEGYEGWYAPSQSGSWEIRVELPAAESKTLTRAEVNGRRIRPSTSEGPIALTGESAPGKPLRWTLRR
jgi:hypothetical protein